MPSGEYRCSIASGELFTAKKGTLGYKLKLVVVEGEHADRVVWHDVWLSEAALPMAKRDLGKLGITSLDQLERPLPDGIVVAAKVALRKNDDGTEFNRVNRLDVVGIETPEPEPFAPSQHPNGDETTDAAGFDWAKGQQKGVAKIMTARPFGFRVVGHRAGRRRLVDWRAALAAYAECDPKAQLEREAYLSHFVFGRDFAEYLEREETEKGYNGPCAADWVFWDIDRPDDLEHALRDARRLAGTLSWSDIGNSMKTTCSSS